MRPQQLTLPSRQSLLHGTTENHKPERVQIIISTAVVLEPQNSVARTCIARVLYQVLGEFIPMPREIPGCSVQAFLQSSCRVQGLRDSVSVARKRSEEHTSELQSPM